MYSGAFSQCVKSTNIFECYIIYFQLYQSAVNSVIATLTVIVVIVHIKPVIIDLY